MSPVSDNRCIWSIYHHGPSRKLIVDVELKGVNYMDAWFQILSLCSPLFDPRRRVSTSTGNAFC